MKRNSRGFTLLELMIVICIIAILTAIAAPTYHQWAENARYREAARDAASILRKAQSMAVSQNTSYLVNFNLGANTSYTLKKNGTTVEDDSFPKGLKIYGFNTSSLVCDSAITTVAITMNPNGSADTSDYVCVMDDSGQKLYRAGVESTATGRVVVQKWDGSWK